MFKTVADIKRELEDYPNDMIVLISSDEEGNRLSAFYEAARGMWATPPEGRTYGEWDTYHPTDIENSREEAEEWGFGFVEPVEVLVFWPSH